MPDPLPDALSKLDHSIEEIKLAFLQLIPTLLLDDIPERMVSIKRYEHLIASTLEADLRSPGPSYRVCDATLALFRVLITYVHSFHRALDDANASTKDNFNQIYDHLKGGSA